MDIAKAESGQWKVTHSANSSGDCGAFSPKERGVGGVQTVFNSLRGVHMGMESLCMLRARLELLGTGGRFSFRERG